MAIKKTFLKKEISWGSRTRGRPPVFRGQRCSLTGRLSVPGGRCALKLAKAITIPLPAQLAALIHQHSPTAAPRGPGQELKPGRAFYLAQVGAACAGPLAPASPRNRVRGRGAPGTLLPPGPTRPTPDQALAQPPAGSGRSSRRLGVRRVSDRELAGLPHILLMDPLPHPSRGTRELAGS